MNTNQTSSETLNAIIIENLNTARELDKIGCADEAKYYRTHAAELTCEILKRKWTR